MFVYSIPMRTRFRRLTVREGALFEGPAGWGEFCAFDDYDDETSAAWWSAAEESASVGWPAPVRDRVPVNCIIPSVPPARAHELVLASFGGPASRRAGDASQAPLPAGPPSRTAKIKVGDARDSLPDDIERVGAVRDALGPGGKIRVDANGAWDVDTAVRSIKALDTAAGGLEYVEQPCATLDELAAVRRRVDVRVAADESIRLAGDPLKVAVAGAADIAVLKSAPLGGVRRALEVAEACGLPCVVSSAVETSVGLAAEIALAGALPSLEFACGLGTLSLLDADVVSSSLVPVDGWLPVLRTPPVPSASLLEAHAASPERRRWWLDRIDRVRALSR